MARTDSRSACMHRWQGCTRASRARRASRTHELNQQSDVQSSERVCFTASAWRPLVHENMSQEGRHRTIVWARGGPALMLRHQIPPANHVTVPDGSSTPVQIGRASFTLTCGIRPGVRPTVHVQCFQPPAGQGKNDRDQRDSLLVLLAKQHLVGGLTFAGVDKPCS